MKDRDEKRSKFICVRVYIGNTMYNLVFIRKREEKIKNGVRRKKKTRENGEGQRLESGVIAVFSDERLSSIVVFRTVQSAPSFSTKQRCSLSKTKKSHEYSLFEIKKL